MEILFGDNGNKLKRHIRADQQAALKCILSIKMSVPPLASAICHLLIKLPDPRLILDPRMDSRTCMVYIQWSQLNPYLAHSFASTGDFGLYRQYRDLGARKTGGDVVTRINCLWSGKSESIYM